MPEAVFDDPELRPADESADDAARFHQSAFPAPEEIPGGKRLSATEMVLAGSSLVIAVTQVPLAFFDVSLSAQRTLAGAALVLCLFVLFVGGVRRLLSPRHPTSTRAVEFSGSPSTMSAPTAEIGGPDSLSARSSAADNPIPIAAAGSEKPAGGQLLELPELAPSIGSGQASMSLPELFQVPAAPPDSSPPPLARPLPVLWVINLASGRTAVRVDKPVWRVGSSETCDLVMRAPDVPPFVLQLEFVGVRWYLRAFVTSVVIVNGAEIPADYPVGLAEGFHVSIGRLMLWQIHIPRIDDIPIPHAQFISHGLSLIGNRDTNQDRYRAGPNFLAVCDGVSGLPLGNEAAQVAVDVITRCARRGSGDLRDWVRQSRDEFISIAQSRPVARLWGTTLDVLRLAAGPDDRPTVEGCHLGDGAAYVLSDGHVWMRMTRDHTVGSELAFSGPERTEAMADGQSTQTSTGHSVSRLLTLDRPSDPDIWTSPAARSQVWIVCSDGVRNAVGEDGLRDHFVRGTTSGHTPRVLLEGLMSEISARAAVPGAAIDNCTALVAQIL